MAVSKVNGLPKQQLRAHDLVRFSYAQKQRSLFG